MYRVNGNAHAMVYDPFTETIYEINYPRNEKGEEIGPGESTLKFKRWSKAYEWKKEDNANWAKLLEREAGNTFALCPINVPDPAAARDWFNANTGHTWWYALGAENCSIYVFKGLRAGGANIHHEYSPAPSSVNSTPTKYWDFPEKP